MSIGASTSNRELLNVLHSIDNCEKMLSPAQIEAVREAKKRIRELDSHTPAHVDTSLPERERFDDWLFNCPVSYDQIEDQYGECTITFRYVEQPDSEE